MAEPPVGTVFVEVRPDFTAFEAELRAKLNVLSRTGVPVAVAQQGALGKATSTTTNTLKTQGKAIEQEVEHLGRFQRGLAATTLSSFGLRGATLAASGAFLAGAALVTVFAKALHAASDEEEAAARVTKVFGDAIGTDLKSQAQELAASFGVAASTALDFEGRIGNLAVQVGDTKEQAASTSEAVVKLAADMAAFSHVGVDKTLRAITLGLVGNSRGLRQFQVELTQARVNQEALRISGKATTDQLTRQEIFQARLNLLFQQTANQQGTAADRADHLAQRSKILSAQLENLGATIGKLLEGPFAGLVGDTTQAVTGLKRIGDEATRAAQKVDTATQGQRKGGLVSGIESFVRTSLPGAIATLTGAIGTFNRATREALVGPQTDLDKLHAAAVKAFDTGNPRDYGKELLKVAATAHDVQVAMDFLHNHAVAAFQQKEIAAFIEGLQHAQVEAARLATKIANISFKRAEASLASFQEKIVDAKIAGTSTADALAGAIASAQREVDAATAASAITVGRSGHDTAVQRRRDAKQQLLDLLTQQRDDRKAAADAAIQLAKDIASAVKDAQAQVQAILDAADQDFLNTIGLEQGTSGLAVIRAGMTKGLADDIAAQKLIQAQLRREIDQARTRISDANTLKQTILSLRTSLLESQAAQAQLAQTVKDNAKQARQDLLDRQKESLELDVQIAETGKNTSKQIKAHEALIRYLQKRRALTSRGSVEWKRLTLEIDQERAAIDDLRKAQKKRNDGLAQAEFEFLQRQSGFAAKLLGNLLPFGAVAGTVGGGAIGTTTPVATASSREGGIDLSGAGPSGGAGGSVIGFLPRVASNQVTGSHTATAGASAGQMSALIHVQRQMLLVLTRLVGQRTHPEASVQKAAQAISLDFF